MKTGIQRDAAKQQRDEQPLKPIAQKQFRRTLRQGHARKETGDQKEAFHPKRMDEVVKSSKGITAAFAEPCGVQDYSEAE